MSGGPPLVTPAVAPVNSPVPLSMLFDKMFPFLACLGVSGTLYCNCSMLSRTLPCLAFVVVKGIGSHATAD